jgi:hypothetical protein
MTDEIKDEGLPSETPKEISKHNFVELDFEDEYPKEKKIRSTSDEKDSEPKKRPVKDELRTTEDTSAENEPLGTKKGGPRHWTRDEWEAAGKDPAKYKSREQFDKDGELFKERDELKRRMKDLEKRLYHQDKEKFDRVKNDLFVQKAQAVHQGDLYRTYQIEQQLADLQYQEPQAPVEEVDNSYAQREQTAVQSFVQKNDSWLNEKSLEAIEMREYMLQIDSRLLTYIESGQLSPEEAVSIVQQEIEKKYPHRFKQHYDDDEESDEDNYQEETLDEIRALKEEIKSLKEPRPQAEVESNSYVRSKFTTRDMPKQYRDAYNATPEKYRKDVSPAQYMKVIKEAERKGGEIEI